MRLTILIISLFLLFGCKKDSVKVNAESTYDIKNIFTISLDYRLFEDVFHSFGQTQCIGINDNVYFIVRDEFSTTRLYKLNKQSKEVIVLIDSLFQSYAYKINHLDGSEYFILQNQYSQDYFLLKNDQILYHGSMPDKAIYSIYDEPTDKILFFYPDASNINLIYDSYDYHNMTLTNIAIIPPPSPVTNFYIFQTFIEKIGNFHFTKIRVSGSNHLVCYDSGVNMLWHKTFSGSKWVNCLKIIDGYLYAGFDNYQDMEQDFYNASVEKLDLLDGSVMGEIKMSDLTSLNTRIVGVEESTIGDEIIFSGSVSNFVYWLDMYNPKLFVGACKKDLQSNATLSMTLSENYISIMEFFKSISGVFSIYGFKKLSTTNQSEPIIIDINANE